MNTMIQGSVVLGDIPNVEPEEFLNEAQRRYAVRNLDLEEEIEAMGDVLREHTGRMNFLERQVVPELIETIDKMLEYFPTDSMEFARQAANRYRSISPSTPIHVAVFVKGGVVLEDETRAPDWVEVQVFDRDELEEEAGDEESDD